LTRPEPPAALSAFSARADEVLARALPPANQPPIELHGAMRYAVLGGGKRLRPVLVYATGQALALFEEGVEQLRAAADELAQAETRVQTLVERADGTFDLTDRRE